MIIRMVWDYEGLKFRSSPNGTEMLRNLQSGTKILRNLLNGGTIMGKAHPYTPNRSDYAPDLRGMLSLYIC